MGFSKPEHKSLVSKMFNYRRLRSYQFTSVAQDLKSGAVTGKHIGLDIEEDLNPGIVI